MCVCGGVHIWKLEENSRQSLLSFHSGILSSNSGYEAGTAEPGYRPGSLIGIRSLCLSSIAHFFSPVNSKAILGVLVLTK